MASAVGALQLVIREYPDVYRAYYMLGGAALAAGDHAAARAMLQRVLELSPGHPTAKLLLDQLPPAS
jgi:cytochrome c-type biogenesis protein CcmH/NrfG